MLFKLFIAILSYFQENFFILANIKSKLVVYLVEIDSLILESF